MPLAPNSAAIEYMSASAGMPRLELPDGRMVDRPHAEWTLHNLRWRWLLDSWEGGESYRLAIYGFDVRGMPIRNLIRHKREYPSFDDGTLSAQTGRLAGSDPATQATDDDYELRRARTPVPGFVAEAVETHLSRIYSKEVKRDGPQHLVDWWLDVDGRGSTMDQWMATTVAPLLLVLGCLDIICDHPAAPDGEDVKTRADEQRLKLDTCRANYILPENMVWWTLDDEGCYEEVIVREIRDDLTPRWQYWNEEAWLRYDVKGKPEGDPTPHPYGCVPIVRLFDRRRPRAKNVGLPRYEIIAEIQREYYNRDSELILSDTTQAHPLLQGPEDFVQPDGTIPIGPNWLLPKKKNMSGGNPTYEGFDVIQFPKDGAESIRQNCDRLRDAADRAAGLTKPAGAAGTQGNTVSQSGVSKRLDASTGNDLLGKIATMLGHAEHRIACLADCVLTDGNPTENMKDAVTIQYPKSFDLWSADELADIIGKVQLILNSGGRAPITEEALITRLIRTVLEGLDDDEYDEMDAEIEGVLKEGPPEPIMPQPMPDGQPNGQMQQDMAMAGKPEEMG